jgi:altronate hydrolase
MSSPAIRIHANDNVVIARRQLLGGTVLAEKASPWPGLVPPGHKVATRAIAAGEPVRRYGQVIGTATQAIAPGQHVHTHNLAFATSSARARARRRRVPDGLPCPTPATFQGIVRADGRVATRNYIGVLTSVNCSATAARAIADHFRRDVHPRRWPTSRTSTAWSR